MSTKFNVLVLNGPNLNMLGLREPEKYGHHTLDDILRTLNTQASQLNVNLSHLQSNSESELINAIHSAWQKIDAIVFNPAAYTHTSVALRDALLSVNIPFYEVHISNVYAREPFRHKSYFSDIAQGVICGLGVMGYQAALTAAVRKLQENITQTK